jgi:hypothetical protein
MADNIINKGGAVAGDIFKYPELVPIIPAKAIICAHPYKAFAVLEEAGDIGIGQPFGNVLKF